MRTCDSVRPQHLNTVLGEEVPSTFVVVCHHFAAIHVQTMWKGKLARRQAELRKLKKKKRSMRRRKAEGQSLLREQAPASPGNPTSGDDSNGDESHDED